MARTDAETTDAPHDSDAPSAGAEAALHVRDDIVRVAIVAPVGDAVVAALRRALFDVSAESPASLPSGGMAAVVAGLGGEPSARKATLDALRAVRGQTIIVIIADQGSVELLVNAAHVVLPATSPADLIVAQVRALLALRAAAPTGQSPDVVTARSLEVDLRRRQVHAGGTPLPLTPAEYAILALLARNPGQAVSHERLLAEIHRASSGERDSRDVLKVHIWRLRAKLLQAVGEDDAIVTVRGFGYLLERRLGKDRRAP